MKISLFRCALLACALLTDTSAAQAPLARASIPDKSGVWVGQRVTLVVELLAPGVFASAPTYELPDPKGALLLPPSGRPVLSNETINGTSYTVQRGELFVFPRQAGTLTIPPCKVRIAFKRSFLDKDPVTSEVTTPSVTFTARTPPGAENLGSILSARKLTVVETWNPEPGKTKAKVGDAFIRTVTFSAPGMPAMAFPPFPVPDVDGLGFYPKAPEVEEHNERGEFQSERRDSVTCICRRAGTFVIPAARLTWFDLDVKKLQTIDFPARTLEVMPNPGITGAKTATSEEPRKREPGILDFLVQVILPVGLVAILIHLKGRTVAEWLCKTFRAVHLAPLNPASSRTKPCQEHDSPPG